MATFLRKIFVLFYALVCIPIGNVLGLYTHRIALEDPAPTPFYGECDGAVSKTFNAVFQSFSDDTLTYRFGNEAAYFEWMAEKIMWTDDALYKAQLKEKMRQYPQTDSGYIWSWTTSVYWPTGDGNIHYDGLFRYVCAAAAILRAENSADFLLSVDTDRQGDNSATDASQGRSVYEKCAAAMTYACTQLHGEAGCITLTPDSVLLADGKTRFDVGADGQLLWNNTGRNGSASSDYWDNLCFGHQDAYETALFYHALEAMAQIETRMGHTASAQTYTSLRSLVHTKFDETFWDADKGRYIACVDADGVRHDYGLTFLNTMALSYGLGDAQKATLIFDWLDGKRIVTGDTITGDAVRSYTDVINANFSYRPILRKLRFALRSNTVDIASCRDENGVWWESLHGAILPDGNASYGRHLENGGYIFFTLFDEWTARMRYGGADALSGRCAEVYRVYRHNSFVSDVGGWAEGLNGEFPENGVVAAVFIRSLLGISEAQDAVIIRPQLPSRTERLGTELYCFGQTTYTVEAGRRDAAMTAKDGFLPNTVVYYPRSVGQYAVECTSADGRILRKTVDTDADGALVLHGLSDYVSVVCRSV